MSARIRATFTCARSMATTLVRCWRNRPARFLLYRRPVTTIGTVVSRLVTWIDRLMPPGSRRDALVNELAGRFGNDDSPITAAACADVERCAWTLSRHVALIHEPDSPTDLPIDLPTGFPDASVSNASSSDASSSDASDPEWPPPDPADVRRRAAGVTEVRRLADGAGPVRIEGLDAMPLAQPYLDAAFTMLRGAERIVLDLRANGGGDPATVALIAGWLLGDTSVKLSEVVYRTGTRQWWTTDRPSGTALRQDAWVLVGPGTFSSGEALAYHLQSHGRVTVVGATTPGAADHVLPVRLAPTVLAHVPNAYVVDAVSGGNWEGSGVVPDVDCPPERALEVACRLLVVGGRSGASRVHTPRVGPEVQKSDFCRAAVWPPVGRTADADLPRSHGPARHRHAERLS